MNFEVSTISNKTLLEGNIKKELVSLAVPLLLGNILQQIYNTVDALIVGQFLGTDAFAAVGISGTIMNLFIFVLNGFCIGLSIIFAQLYGAGNQDEFRREVFVSISFGSLITVLLSALFVGILSPILHLIQTPDALIPYVTSYLTIIIVGMITTYFYNLFSSILRSIGNTKAALYFLFLSVAINAVVDYLFVAVFSLGVAGAAYATVLAQMISAAGCYCYLFKNYRYLLCRRKDVGIHAELVKQTLGYGFASALQQASLYIGKILVQGAVNTLGISGIAAYTATMRIEGFANSFGDSGAQAMSVFTSQNYGAGNERRVSDGLRQGLVLHIILGIMLSIIMFITAKAGMLIFLKADETLALDYGTLYLKIISIFYVLCFIGSAFVGYFRGTGKVIIPVVGTTLHIGLRVIISYLLISKLGLSAIAIATGLGWVLVVLYQITTYRKRDSKIQLSNQVETGE
jgi:putative MATE family efflux protein